MTDVKITESRFENEHLNQKFFVIKGEVAGIPEATKTRSINVLALADGKVNLEDEITDLVAVVTEYARRVLALNKARKELKDAPAIRRIQAEPADADESKEPEKRTA